MAGASQLQAWMNGELVGTWSVVRGQHSFTYDAAWLQSDKARALSLSMPITPTRQVTGEVVQHYFDNLLPDSERIRQRIQQRFGTMSTGAFDLLQAIGRDCVGAVQLLPDGLGPEGWDRVDCEVLTDAQVGQWLRDVPSSPLGRELAEDAAFRISLAGAQEKTALLQVGGRWCRPVGATPSTHIFKLPLGLIANTSSVDMFDSVQNEWVCAQLLAALGLPVAEAEMARFGEEEALVVRRFDRQWMDGGRWIARLPQEDFCQALGRPSRLKYENEQGGVSSEDGLRLLAGSADAQTDRLAFLLAQLAFWLMAAPDGHAKNFSIFLGRGGLYGMTPLYDVLSVWPYLGGGRGQIHERRVKLAMAVRGKNAHYDLPGILPRHWQATAMRHGGEAMWRAMRAFVAQVGPALAAVESRLPEDFPERIWEPIATGMQRQARKFESQQAGT